MANQQTPELEQALNLAAERQASDIYLIPGEPLALRINGSIQRVEGDPLLPEQIRRMAAAAVGEDRLAEVGSERGAIVTSCGVTGVINGQLAIARTRGDLSIAIHILPIRIPSVEETGIPPAVIREARSASGLIIFSGLMGSGKTTSMLSLVDHINTNQSRHICTIEDPIEVHIASKRSLVQQREVGVDVPDMASGIVAALQHSADVLLIGELRTAEEVEACVRVALLGKLVITQAHGITPQAAIRRLIECQSPEKRESFRRDFSHALRAVTAQILLPRSDGRGKLAAYGVLIPDDATRQAIAEGPPRLDSARLPPGSQSLLDDIDRLRRQRLIDDRAAEDAIQLIRLRS